MCFVHFTAAGIGLFSALGSISSSLFNDSSLLQDTFAIQNDKKHVKALTGLIFKGYDYIYYIHCYHNANNACVTAQAINARIYRSFILYRKTPPVYWLV